MKELNEMKNFDSMRRHHNTQMNIIRKTCTYILWGAVGIITIGLLASMSGCTPTPGTVTDSSGITHRPVGTYKNCVIEYLRIPGGTNLYVATCPGPSSALTYKEGKSPQVYQIVVEEQVALETARLKAQALSKLTKEEISALLPQGVK
jgi:hypothetical protein